MMIAFLTARISLLVVLLVQALSRGVTTKVKVNLL